jgi:2-methylcitrate dehydratase PrpD
MGPTETLAHYISSVKFEDIPDDVVTKAKECIQDHMACALGGAQTELGRRHIELAKELGGKGGATLIGDGAQVACVSAAQANTELTNVLDFDDMHWLTLAHPGCSIFGSALAVTEMMGGSGKDFITALIMGYEAGLRVGRSIRSVVTRPDGKKEVMSNPSYALFACVAAASKGLGLGPAQIVNAFGLAGSTPINRGQSRVHHGGINAHPYTDNKYDMGTYAMLGVFNSLRARRLDGPKGALDDDRFATRCSANNFNAAELTAALGTEYRIMEIAFKPVCFGAVAGSPVTALLDALNGEVLKPEAIQEITLIGIPRLECYEWSNMIEAEFSTPCAIAMAVVGEESGPQWFNSGRFKDPDIFEIARKVKFVEDPKAREKAIARGQWMCTAEIRTKDGKVRRAHADYEKGAPENPFTEKERRRKFMLGSTDLLGQKRADAAWDKLQNLESVGKISDVARDLC